MLPTLQTLLAQNNATLVQSNGLYRVMPADQAASTPAIATATRRSAAPWCCPCIMPPPRNWPPCCSHMSPKAAAIAADPNTNALVIQGDPATRDALTGLVQAFDIDALAGQSYELFPVADGDAQDFADAFTAALGKQR